MYSSLSDSTHVCIHKINTKLLQTRTKSQSQTSEVSRHVLYSPTLLHLCKKCTE